MAEGLLQMRSRPLRQRGLFSVPVDEETRSVLLPFAEREGEFSFALPQAAIEAYESFTLPGQAARGELGAPGSPEMVQGATRFGVDFGMLPALAGGLLTPVSPNTLRMGMGGADTVSGGARRGPEVDELGFYSKALETARMLPQEKGTGQQFRSMLTKAGVKEDEIRFTPGLEGLLSQPKVTRDELVGLLEESRIRPEETVFYANDAQFEGLNFPREPEVLDLYDFYGRDNVRNEINMILDESENASELLANLQGYPQERIDELAQIIDEEGFYSDKISLSEQNDLADVAEAIVTKRYNYDPVYRWRDPDTGYEIVGSDSEGYSVDGPHGFVGDMDSFDEARVQADYMAREYGLIGYEGGTRFMDYTEPGGSNYREMLLQVPEYEGMTDEFIATGHFQEPNIVVHARTKDRSSSSGTDDILYVEELQSDWGQRGRERGFKGAVSDEDLAILESKAKKDRQDYVQKGEEYGLAVKDFTNKLVDKINQLGGPKVHRTLKGIEFVVPPFSKATLTPQSTIVFDSSSIDWMFSTGESLGFSTQTAAGNLGRPGLGDIKSLVPKNSRELKDSYYKAQETQIESSNALLKAKGDIPYGPLVGSSEKFAEVGIKRLINQAAKEGKRYVTFSSGEVQADRWNNEGLNTFYDKIIPKVGKKVAGRLDKDALVDFRYFEDATGDVSGDRFTIEITDKMREEALRGQPLFIAPAVPTGAGGLLGDDRRVDTVEDFYRAGIL